MALLICAGLAACGDEGCGSGADSAPQAVELLLQAGDSAEARCKYVAASVADQAESWQQSVWTALGTEDPAGLVIEEDGSRRMGGEHVVTITGPNDQVVDVVVVEEGDAFLVIPGTEPTLIQ